MELLRVTEQGIHFPAIFLTYSEVEEMETVREICQTVYRRYKKASARTDILTKASNPAIQ